MPHLSVIISVTAWVAFLGEATSSYTNAPLAAIFAIVGTLTIAHTLTTKDPHGQ